eukprot:s4109_g7.t1
MGQRASDQSEKVAETEADTSAYKDKDLAELRQLAAARGIFCPSDSVSPGSQSSFLLALLAAYDAGVAATTSAAKHVPSRQEPPTAVKGQQMEDSMGVCPSVLEVLQRIRQSPGHMGVDIGGSLVKMAIALPFSVASGYNFPSRFGESGCTHGHLELMLWSGGTPFVVRFVSGATSQMEHAVQHFGLRRNRSWAFSRQDSVEKLDMLTRSPKSPYCSSSGHWKASDCTSGLDWDDASLSTIDTLEVPTEVPATESRHPRVRRVAAAGGGACKFAPLFRNSLHVEIEPVKELSAVVDGLLLLANFRDAKLEHGTAEQGTCPTDLFTTDEVGRPSPLPWPAQLFPLILVNMGSGVSILKVDSAKSNDYTRVGGTACGGATFLGLARTLTSARTFEEALMLAERGDASKADKLVRDIYGEDGSASLGLAGGLTASNFGKLSDLSPAGARCSEYDLARSLLQMVTQQSVLLAAAFAKHADCLDRVFFVGGFIDEPNRLARAAIAQNFRSLGGCAYFLRHSDFLGALGSLHHAFQVTASLLESISHPRAMAYQNFAGEQLTFDGLQFEDIFASNGGVLSSLKKYDKFIEIFVNDPNNASKRFPRKITKDRVVTNKLIRAWASWKAPPLLLIFVCGGLPPNGDVGVRVREITRACILAAPPDVQRKCYGDVFGTIIKMGGAMKHLAADKAKAFQHIRKYLDEIRFDLNTYAIEVVNDTNFFNLDVVANNTEVPHQAMSSTRTDMRYTVNQDYYGRIPRTTSPQGDHSELLSEEQLQRLCGIMYDFAKQVGYGLRTYNKEAGSSSTSSSTSSAMLNIHQLALMLRGMPQGMDHPLAYALNSFQAFTVCLHAIYKYTSWRAYDTNEPYYWWSAEIMPDAETTTLEFLEHHIEAVCKPQRENGLHLPPDLKLYAWNQLAVESGYVHE